MYVNVWISVHFHPRQRGSHCLKFRTHFQIRELHYGLQFSGFLQLRIWWETQLICRWQFYMLSNYLEIIGFNLIVWFEFTIANEFLKKDLNFLILLFYLQAAFFTFLQSANVDFSNFKFLHQIIFRIDFNISIMRTFDSIISIWTWKELKWPFSFSDPGYWNSSSSICSCCWTRGFLGSFVSAARRVLIEARLESFPSCTGCCSSAADCDRLEGPWEFEASKCRRSVVWRLIASCDACWWATWQLHPVSWRLWIFVAGSPWCHLHSRSSCRPNRYQEPADHRLRKT